MNYQFDSLPPKTEITDYENVEWSGLSVDGNGTTFPHSMSHYAFSENGEAIMSTTTDYFYLIGFYFGCGAVNSTSGIEAVEACKLQVSGSCLPVGFPAYNGGEAARLVWSYQYKPHAVHGKANMTYASLYDGKTTYKGTSKTNHPVLCTNYTLTATTASGSVASLYLDDVNLALYTSSYY